MSEPPKLKPTTLDPLGAVIYYICVVEAIKSGTWTVPSSQKVSEMLRLENGRPLNEHVRLMWDDLRWVMENKFLFSETVQSDSFTPRFLTQVNVNRRIRKFAPGFKQLTDEDHQHLEEQAHHHYQRYLDERDFVDQSNTAVRLVAFKDLYIATGREVQQKLLLEFLTKKGLANEDQYYGKGGFLSVMHHIKYIDFPGLPREEEFTATEKDNPLLVVPGGVFRRQDLYLELRALDYFAEQPSDAGRRRRLRGDLHRSAARFASERPRKPRAS